MTSLGPLRHPARATASGSRGWFRGASVLMAVGLLFVTGCASTYVAEEGPSGRPSTCRFGPLVRRVASETQVDPGLIAGVAAVESRWNPRAKSRSGARGLMQVMPSTARGLRCGDLYEPLEGLRCGARLLARLLERYAGSEPYALAAYAQGARGVDAAYRAGRPAPRQPFLDKVQRERARWLEACRRGDP